MKEPKIDKYEELAELLVGDNALERYTHEELKDYIENLKDLEDMQEH